MFIKYDPLINSVFDDFCRIHEQEASVNHLHDVITWDAPMSSLHRHMLCIQHEASTDYDVE